MPSPHTTLIDSKVLKGMSVSFLSILHPSAWYPVCTISTNLSGGLESFLYVSLSRILIL